MARDVTGLLQNVFRSIGAIKNAFWEEWTGPFNTKRPDVVFCNFVAFESHLKYH